MSADPYPRSIESIKEYATVRPCIEPVFTF